MMAYAGRTYVTASEGYRWQSCGMAWAWHLMVNFWINIPIIVIVFTNGPILLLYRSSERHTLPSRSQCEKSSQCFQPNPENAENAEKLPLMWEEDNNLAQQTSRSHVQKLAVNHGSQKTKKFDMTARHARSGIRGSHLFQREVA